jgi:DNA-binding NarL/FixJ family response regulator
VPTILIVDDHLGFVFWLGQALQREQYGVLPAMAVTDAITLLPKCVPSLDLLIINLGLPGAPDFVRALRKSREHIKVIALARETEPSPEYYPLVDALLLADVNGRVDRSEYLRLIHSVLASHETSQ